MPQFQELSLVTRVEQLSAGTCRLTLLAPEIGGATRAGQFVMVRVGASKDPLLRRPFSVHQTDSGGHIQIFFRIVGKGTDMLARIREGEEISVFGPLGRGFQLVSGRPACLVGGGIGIAPMLLLAKELCRRQNCSPSDRIILGGRTAGEVEPLVDDFRHFGMHLHCTTDDGSYGRQGRTLDALRDATLPPDTVVYACGPEPMLAAVAMYCAQKQLACQVSVESVMACGMGACLGCNRPLRQGGYAHVCVDGPVFDAQDLLWNL